MIFLKCSLYFLAFLCMVYYVRNFSAFKGSTYSKVCCFLLIVCITNIFIYSNSLSRIFSLSPTFSITAWNFFLQLLHSYYIFYVISTHWLEGCDQHRVILPTEELILLVLWKPVKIKIIFFIKYDDFSRREIIVITK